MAIEDDIRILETVGLFETFTRDQLRLLAFGTERLVLREGRELYREGQSADCAYVIDRGEISLFREGTTGRVILKTVGPGAVLGEMAIIAQTKRLTSAMAEAETEVIRLNRSLFRRILEEYPEIAAALHDKIASDISELIDAITQYEHLFQER
ncbi:cyclic nucleotide-binding protein [Phyllobacterium sp. YR620]|jgi:CRP-like cAMP-binding protein|uniref:Cyclic nucleotide-binding domain-containing protein n=1 Tax=Phyllobacterium pellucidum TaxID=2740464 RepID=A0A849VRI0_9HYPH|nr:MULTISPECIES: cyclic nucleotide-binding domain-containing protein [Phyllobacterium]MRG54815.1 cyclic nucleotide-binding domain-containing protein [Phyllobacterium sp. SYP-B3895]NTS32618.1 cyclic nucleotide-binding domain-containing protein [Phyllobacterium pellucidum]UGY10000.1 cyclic nucleotide-binding domain-containing protein [Phyllobacterium sp. T1018]SDP39252.1 cyclic nucleotide-binding protein [Phyllobacterium sp. YR620]SFI76037.1 Cyclic nucleotide-binding domain-containing protein [P